MTDLYSAKSRSLCSRNEVTEAMEEGSLFLYEYEVIY
jgi:hypothetical protein